MHYEKEFKELQKRYVQQTDCYDVMAKILKRMKASKKNWWYAYEFVDIHYKAPQRLSDLAIYYSELVEARAIRPGNGKPKVYRLKSTKFPKWAVDN